MGEPTVPERVYRDAAEARARAVLGNDEEAVAAFASAVMGDDALHRSFRAAVESAYRAGRASMRVVACDGRWCNCDCHEVADG